MPRLMVTDHALIRFLERSEGIDMEAVRASVADALARAHEAASSIGVANYLVLVDELCFIVRGCKVITILQQPSARRRAIALSSARIK